MDRLAITYHESGRYREAEDLRPRVIDKIKKIQGDEHSDTLEALGALGVIYTDQGKKGEAENLVVKLLDIKRKILGEEHPVNMRDMGVIGRIYRQQGRLEEVEMQVLEMSMRTIGEKSQITLISMAFLATKLHCMGYFSDAHTTLMSRCIDMSSNVMGAESPDTVNMRKNLYEWTAVESYVS